MKRDSWTEMDKYICSRLVREDLALNAALEASLKAGLPPANVSPNQGKFLYLLAMIRGARRILEIGTLGGYSTIWLARALPADGVLVSIEVKTEHAAVAKKNLQFARLSHKVSIMIGRAVETLEHLIEEKVEPFDLVFIDADKGNYPLYLHMVLDLARAGTVIVCDNIVRNGRVGDFTCNASDVTGIRQYIDLVAGQSRVESTALQTVGSKGWDGFCISLVTA